MQGTLAPSLLAFLPQWMARQRWYAGKGRLPELSRIGGLRLEDPAAEVDIDVHLLLDESGDTPTTYQVPLTTRTARLPGGDRALVATFQPVDDSGAGPRYVYDAPHDPAFVTALLRLMLDEGTATFDREQSTGGGSGSDGGSGTDGGPGPDGGSGYGADGHRLARADPGQLFASRVLTGEQSNTSIIIDLTDAHGDPSKPLICKLFRVLHHGQNPDVVVPAALSAAGSTRVPCSVGYVSGRWPNTQTPEGPAAGHLAYAQEFLPGVEDAWRVALAAVGSGTDFDDQARSLGQATAEVHATLAQAMGTREPTQDDVASLTRSMRARHAAAVSEVPAMAAYDQMIRASIEAVSSARWPALQRIHGDYHLAQVLNAPGRGWVLVDFEGEPMRPLPERTQPDLALRDVAGMLRSFDYVAGSWEQDHPGHSAAPWATMAREAFLEGYASSAGRDPREDAVLLNALELDKALYEVVYEARNRPTWLGIPTTAIVRLTTGPRSDPRS
jgi:predicted trehalose synthase